MSLISRYGVCFRSARSLVWAALVLLCLPAALAQKNEGFRVIRWSPARLESGSPVLFTIELGQAASELHGTWVNHALVFTKAKEGNTWYALAGIDVEQAPGSYTLELNATGSNGSPFHASREVIVQPGRYKTTTLHVEEKYVQPDAATLQRIAADKAVKDAAFAHLISRPLWKGSFRFSCALYTDRFFRNPAHVQRNAGQHPSRD